MPLEKKTGANMFITLEGIEGSGKTTQLEHMVEYLALKGHDCTVTREPGGTEIGQQIRAILLNPDNKALAPLSELLLYAADRAQHINTKIIPDLSAGKTVVCDRFFDATTVYQGYGRALPVSIINKLHEIVLGGLKPDLTILFDLPVDVGLSRAWKQINDGSRSDLETRFEKEALAFHQKIRDGYLELAGREPDRFRVIDAGGSREMVQEAVCKTLALHLGTD